MRKVQKYRYGAAFILTVMVFLMGVMFSNLMDQTRSQSLDNEMQEDLVELESNQLQLSYLRSDDVQSCGVLRAGLTNIVKGYNQRLDRVQQYQQDSFFRSQEFGNIKRQYILSGMRYWVFAEEVRERCEYSPDTVLFFTSTLEKENCSECDRMGRQLTLLKRKYGNDLLIFSIPTQMDDGMVDILINQFNVTEEPTVVVNGNETIKGFHHRSEVEKYLTQDYEGDGTWRNGS